MDAREGERPRRRWLALVVSLVVIGGFGFLVEPGGACEIKDVRVKVLSTSE